MNFYINVLAYLLYRTASSVGQKRKFANSLEKESTDKSQFSAADLMTATMSSLMDENNVTSGTAPETSFSRPDTLAAGDSGLIPPGQRRRKQVRTDPLDQQLAIFFEREQKHSEFLKSEDAMFCLSLVDSLKAMAPKQKSAAKIKIQQVIHEHAYGNVLSGTSSSLSANYPQSNSNASVGSVNQVHGSNTMYGNTSQMYAVPMSNQSGTNVPGNLSSGGLSFHYGADNVDQPTYTNL
jgi:hypothetical protein